MWKTLSCFMIQMTIMKHEKFFFKCMLNVFVHSCRVTPAFIIMDDSMLWCGDGLWVLTYSYLRYNAEAHMARCVPTAEARAVPAG